MSDDDIGEPQKSPQKTSWNVLDRQLVYDAAPWVQLFREQVELPSGHRIDDFYHVRLPDYCEILAVTPQGKLVMVRGYQHAARRVLLSPPAGMIEQEEDPLTAARRELLEETGYTATTWRKLGQFVTDGNRHCGTMHLLHAVDAIRSQAPRLEESEALVCELHDLNSVTRALMAGEIGNLPGALASAMGILLLQREEAQSQQN